MASYYVSAVNYNSDGTHIAKLKVHKVTGEGKFSSSGEELTRPKVIELIKNGDTFTTIVPGSEGKWNIGSKLEIFPVTTDYLKTKNDKSTKDNLENLPPIK